MRGTPDVKTTVNARLRRTGNTPVDINLQPTLDHIFAGASITMDYSVLESHTRPTLVAASDPHLRVPVRFLYMSTDPHAVKSLSISQLIGRFTGPSQGKYSFRAWKPLLE